MEVYRKYILQKLYKNTGVIHTQPNISVMRRIKLKHFI